MIIEPLKGLRFAVRSECCNSFKFLGLQLNQIGTLIYNIVMTDGSCRLTSSTGWRTLISRQMADQRTLEACMPSSFR